MSVNRVNFSGIFVPCVDEEEQKIARRLRQYGQTPTGSKTSDKMKLHEIELREAQKESCVTSKFLTVTKQEQEKIQEKKKEKRIETTPKECNDDVKGQKALGEQIYLAIKMKNKKK